MESTELERSLTGDAMFGATPQRWWVLVAFCALTTCNGMIYIQFAPVRSEAAHFYGVSGDYIDVLAMLFLEIYVLIFAPCVWQMEGGAGGLQRCLRISSLINLVGALMRWASVLFSKTAVAYWVAFAGQATCAIAQGWTLGAPPRISGLWFGQEEWGLSTGIGVMFNQVGGAIAFAVAPLLVTDAHGNGMGALLGFSAALALVAALAVWLAIPPAPARPPSCVAAARSDAEVPSLGDFIHATLMLHTDGPVCRLALGYGLCVGVLYAFETLLQELLPGRSTRAISVVGLTMLLAGLPGAFLGGAALDATKQYRETTTAFTAVAAVAMGGFFWAASSLVGQGMVEAVWDNLLGALFGLMLCAVLSAGFEFGVEVAFPAAESQVAGLLNAWGQIMGVVMIYAMEPLAAARGASAANAVLLVSLLLAVLLFAAVGTRQKRQAEATRLEQLL